MTAPNAKRRPGGGGVEIAAGQPDDHPQCTPPRRHPGCSGCCACLPLPLPRPTVPVPTVERPAWLDDNDTFFRAVDVFTVDVVHNRALTRTERVEAARAFYKRWGAAELRRALHEAARIRELPSELREIVDKVAA